MSDLAFRQLLDLLMCSDPEPCPTESLRNFADDEARDRGFRDWVDAYHRFD